MHWTPPHVPDWRIQRLDLGKDLGIDDTWTPPNRARFGPRTVGLEGIPSVDVCSVFRPGRRSTVRLGRALSKRMAVLGGDQYGWALLTSWVLTVAYQTLFFCVAATFKFDKVTDFAGGTNFVVVALVSLFFGGLQSARQIVVTVLVSTWGARLSLFLLFRILLWGEGRRFDDKRDNLVTFAAFWIFQAVWVWIVTIPVVVLNGGGGAGGAGDSLGALDYVGWAIWGVGFFVEVVSDFQKLAFKRDPSNSGKWCNVGLWYYSRHPNYFGEILLWWGVLLACYGGFSGANAGVYVLGALSPLFLTNLLLFVSGLPLLEQSADKKHGGKEEYREYKRRTSPLVILPPTTYERLPKCFKTYLLFELPLYNNMGDAVLQEQMVND